MEPVTGAVAGKLRDRGVLGFVASVSRGEYVVPRDRGVSSGCVLGNVPAVTFLTRPLFDATKAYGVDLGSLRKS